MRMSEEDWDVVVDTNLKGTFNSIKAVSRQMVRQRYGRIVNITSVAGIQGTRARQTMPQPKRDHWSDQDRGQGIGVAGITCNAVAPGLVPTDLTASLPADLVDLPWSGLR